jgi:hypothetical protein
MVLSMRRPPAAGSFAGLSKDEQALAVPLAMRHEAALEPEMGGTDCASHGLSGKPWPQWVSENVECIQPFCPVISGSRWQHERGFQ